MRSSERRAILAKPHFEHLMDMPALATLPERELIQLDVFLSFCAREKLDDPRASDVLAFAVFADRSAEDMRVLSDALRSLGAEDAFCTMVWATGQARPAPPKAREKSSTPSRPRIVAVKPEELPEDWQMTLADLWVNETYSPEVLKRMEARLCRFAWSAQKAGHPVDLECVASLQAYYQDQARRSADRNDGKARLATLRSSFEEFCRFGAQHDLNEAGLARLNKTYRELCSREGNQRPLKFAKVPQIGGIQQVMRTANALLREAETKEATSRRHQTRNAAAALAIGCIHPARPADVVEHHIFGAGLFYDEADDRYRFRYTPVKTRDTIPKPLNLPLDQAWNVFIDALILQDASPRYLSTLRDKVIKENRPLYVDFDGRPLAYTWYSRIWEKRVGTGGHIARTLLYDEMADRGELGLRYAQKAANHTSTKIRDHYRSEIALTKEIWHAQTLLDQGQTEDDLSDL
jgi:hypothetical protein